MGSGGESGHAGMEGSQGVLVAYSSAVVIGAGSAVAGMVGTKVLLLRSLAGVQQRLIIDASSHRE